MKELIAEKIYSKDELLEILKCQRENIESGDAELVDKIRYLDNNGLLIKSIKDDDPQSARYLIEMFKCDDGNLETKITLMDE